MGASESLAISKKWKFYMIYLYLNLACLSVCLFVCLFVSNKRQNGWTDRAKIFCGTSRDPRKKPWMIKILKIYVKKFFFTKWRCSEIKPQLKVEIEDGREAP